MWALVVNGSVAEVTDRDPTGRFHPSFNWMACDNTTVAGQVLSGTRFIAAATPAPIIPPVVSMAQAVVALHNTPGHAAGRTLLDDVNDAVAASPDPTVPLIWSRATTVDRNGRIVAALSASLSLSSAQVDALFTAAAAVIT